MSAWRWEDLDPEFLRGVASRLSPDWFWDVDKVPSLLETIAGEMRKKLRAPGDSLVVPGLGTVSVIMFRHGGSEWPILHVDHVNDWPFSVQARPVKPFRPLSAPPPPPPRPTDPIRRCPEMREDGWTKEEKR